MMVDDVQVCGEDGEYFETGPLVELLPFGPRAKIITAMSVCGYTCMYALASTGDFEWSFEERDLTLNQDVRVRFKHRAERLSAEKFREGLCVRVV